MELNDRIEQIADKVNEDKEFAAKFNSDPEKAVDSLMGKQILDEAIDEIVEGVRELIEIEEAEDAIEDVSNKSIF